MSPRLITYLLITAILLGTAVPVVAQSDIKCAACGKKITGDYVVYSGKIYHKGCYQQIAPRCVHYGEILSGECVEAEGKPYHQECYINNAAEHCAVCGEPILGSYRVDFWGNKYHAEHEAAHPACDYCGRVVCERVTGGGVNYDDGRKVCNICLQSAVFEEDIEPLILDVARILDDNGLRVDMKDVPVNLVDMKTLARLSGMTANTRELGFCRCNETKMLGKKVRQMNMIYLLYGLPKRVFESALAHEMMHVWMNRNAEMRPKPLLAEGAANYASFIVLSQRDDKMARLLIKNLQEDPDLIYGLGFRSVRKYIDRKGLPAFIDYLRTHDRIPR